MKTFIHFFTAMFLSLSILACSHQPTPVTFKEVPATTTTDKKGCKDCEDPNEDKQTPVTNQPEPMEI